MRCECMAMRFLMSGFPGPFTPIIRCALGSQCSTRDAEKQRLYLRVMDKDFLTSDDLIGETSLVLSEELADGAAHGLDVELTGPEHDSRLQMAVKFLPFDGAPHYLT